MKRTAPFASLIIAASAALLSAPSAVAAPLAGPLSLGEAAVAPIVEVREARHTRHTSHPRRAYRGSGYRGDGAAYGYPGYGAGYGYQGYGDFGRRGCVRGSPAETSAYPSWMVCHDR